MIPPAIFHTLIENAITHNGYRDDRVTFRLEELREGDLRRYVLTTPATKKDRQADGLGLKYVKTRLEEMFPGRWRVESVPLGSQWTTTIEVAG
jgi:LytS/YehU family sensor histidine kinase